MTIITNNSDILHLINIAIINDTRWTGLLFGGQLMVSTQTLMHRGWIDCAISSSVNWVSVFVFLDVLRTLHSFTHTFIHSVSLSLVYRFRRSLISSFIYSFIQSLFVRSFLLINSFSSVVHSFIRFLIRSFIIAFSTSFIRSSVFYFVHSFTLY